MKNNQIVIKKSKIFTRKTLTVQNLTVFALLIALKIVLSRVAGVNFGIFKISFAFIASSITGYLFGPYLAAIAGGMTDIIGFFLFPSGTYFPGYTLTSMVVGLIYGFMLHNQKLTFKRILITMAMQAIICNLLLNTLWTSILFGKAFFAILPARILKNLITIPIESMLLYIIFKYLQQPLRNIVRN